MGEGIKERTVGLEGTAVTGAGVALVSGVEVEEGVVEGYIIFS